MGLEINSDTAITSINPANKQTLGQIPVSTSAEIAETVARAAQVFKAWRRVPLAERLEKIEHFRRVLFEQRETVAQLITTETGKPKVEALVSEVFGALETCAWLKKNTARVLTPEKVHLNPVFFPGKRSYNVFEPLGVIGVISPWNYPFSIPVSTILASLAVGNAVVLKPSPKTALTAKLIIDLFRQAGFPPDLVGLVQGDRQEAEQLILSPINRVMFTGSVGGGKAIMALAAKKLLPVTLELGGKHAAIVLSDSNVECVAKPILWAAFTNAGQACASIERLYVEKPLAPALSARLAELAKQLRLGDGLHPDTDVGPVLDEQQMLRVQQQVDEAVRQGARILAGGNSRPDLGGYFFEPTVLADVTADMPIAKEEIFGPVLPIILVDNAEEAIRLTNTSHLGLGASLWTPDLRRAELLAREIEAGIVWINDGLYTHVTPDAPWGGIKESGFGRMHSAAELRDLVYTKNVGVNAPREQDWNYPYSQHNLNHVRGGVELTHSRSLSGMVGGLRKVLAAMIGRRSQ
jgi:acyl-CoA reductase-like NAD-dependent aldehyde dehydrogenase